MVDSPVGARLGEKRAIVAVKEVSKGEELIRGVGGGSAGVVRESNTVLADVIQPPLLSVAENFIGLKTRVHVRQCDAGRFGWACYGQQQRTWSR